MLANPNYIKCKDIFINKEGLSDNQYFEDGKFLSYLKYLQFWSEPEYIIYIK